MVGPIIDSMESRSAARRTAVARDQLEEALHRIRLRGDFYCQAELSAPWRLEMPAIQDSISFHVVTEGTCILSLEGQAPAELRSGDLALVPHGRGHHLATGSDAGSSSRVDLLPQEYIGPQHSRLVHGGGGVPSRLICGIVGFEAPAARELARRLPPLILMPRNALAADSRILDSVRMMGEELALAQVGGDVVASRLADIIVVQAIRAWLINDPAAQSGWFLALSDERIGKALQAIQADPGAPWDVLSLARTATMSRSLFSERFTEMIGETPMAYLTRWRMDVACTLMRAGSCSTAEVAQDVGYRSEASFARAFQRVIGCSPAAWRKSGPHADGRQGQHSQARPALGPRPRET